MNQEDKINHFSELIQRAEQLINRSKDDQDFKKWRKDTEIAIEN